MMKPNIHRLSNEEVKATYHEIVTPEGVPLRLKVSLAGDRILAFAFDFFLINLAMMAVAICAPTTPASKPRCKNPIGPMPMHTASTPIVRPRYSLVE